VGHHVGAESVGPAKKIVKPIKVIASVTRNIAVYP
jgi:hypothetical protein